MAKEKEELFEDEVTAEPQEGLENDTDTTVSEQNLAELEQLLQKMETEFSKTQTQLAESKEALMRTAAEYENYRKRTTIEKEASFNNGIGFAISSLLPLIDTLEMAEAAETADADYKKGVTLTLVKCHDAFKVLNVVEIDALGVLFDPNLHNAVMQEAAEEGIEVGTITKVLQKGYALGEKVIRHASVAVAK